jgi:ribosome maturation factor RimP
MGNADMKAPTGGVREKERAHEAQPMFNETFAILERWRPGALQIVAVASSPEHNDALEGANIDRRLLMGLSSGGLPASRFFVARRSALRGKTPEDLQLIDILDPVAEATGYEIVRLRMMGGVSRRTLQIMAERPDGDMNVDDCAALSRALSDILDPADIIAGDYVLEVSSPGVDRPLTRLKDFEAFEGFEARIELDRIAEGRKRFRGVLAGVEDDHVCLDLEGEAETTLIPFAWIVDAKLSLTDELMKRGAERRAARVSDERDHDDQSILNSSDEDA